MDWSIKGASFVMTFSDMKQRNKADAAKVRDIRRATAEGRIWWLVETVLDKDGNPAVLSARDSAQIDQGVGERTLAHGGVLYATTTSNFGTLYVDIKNQLAYDKIEEGARPRRMMALPMTVSNYCEDISGDLPPTSELYRVLETQFEATKWGGRKAPTGETLTIEHHEELRIAGIEYHIRRNMLVSFLEKMHRMGEGARLMIVYHGTGDEARRNIINGNFSISTKRLRNNGWFGKGNYFGRRAFTAIGYASRVDELLCCLVVVKNVYNCPPPDDSSNECHGQLQVTEGYDAHLSPSGKELVIWNPRQILPCFVLKFNKVLESAEALSEYQR